MPYCSDHILSFLDTSKITPLGETTDPNRNLCDEIGDTIDRGIDLISLLNPFTIPMRVYDCLNNIESIKTENEHLTDLLDQSQSHLRNIMHLARTTNALNLGIINNLQKKTAQLMTTQTAHLIDIDQLSNDLSEYTELYNVLGEENTVLTNTLEEHKQTIVYLHEKLHKLETIVGITMGFSTCPINMDVNIDELDYDPAFSEYIRLYGMPEEGLMSVDIDVLNNIKTVMSICRTVHNS